MLVRLASELVRDIRAHTVRINALRKELAALVAPLAPRLLALPGCGVLITAKILGEVGRIDRFRSESCFAMHAGVAPIPASSGKTTRYRLARGGNRQLNAALHRIAVSQIRLGGPGSVYYQRRRAGGDTTMEALRYARSNAASPASSTACCAPPRQPTRRLPQPDRREPASKLHPVDLAPPDRAAHRVQPSTSPPADLVQLCTRGAVW